MRLKHMNATGKSGRGRETQGQHVYSLVQRERLKNIKATQREERLRAMDAAN